MWDFSSSSSVLPSTTKQQNAPTATAAISESDAGIYLHHKMPILNSSPWTFVYHVDLAQETPCLFMESHLLSPLAPHLVPVFVVGFPLVVRFREPPLLGSLIWSTIIINRCNCSTRCNILPVRMLTHLLIINIHSLHWNWSSRSLRNTHSNHWLRWILILGHPRWKHRCTNPIRTNAQPSWEQESAARTCQVKM